MTNNPTFCITHPWQVSLEEAARIQEKLSQRIILKNDFKKIENVLGVGVIFSRKQDESFIGCVSFSFPELHIKGTAFHKEKLKFPYVPGFFAFSVGPAILTTIKKLERPDLIMFPGRGIVHPRGLGLASHLGILLGLPTIACSKTPLWRDYPEPSLKKGANVFVESEEGKIIGAVVRTREGKKPIFVTPGNKISVQTVVRIVLQSSPRYRIPEPLRQAHILATKMSKPT